MSDFTLKQGKDYVRVKVKELKNDTVVDSMLTIDFNLSIVKVQSDLMEVGIKHFLKTAYLNNPIAELPTDLMPIPNAIRDVRASAGTKAFVSTALGGNNDITYTAIQPGTPGGGIRIQYVDNGFEPIGVYSVDIADKLISIGFSSSLPVDELTANAVVESVNNDLLASSLVTAANKTGSNGTGAIEETSVITSGATGTGWKPADEKTIKDSNRMEDNYIESSSVNFPKYVIKGDSKERKIIEFYPKDINYSEITYFNTISEMTADTDLINMPLQFRELVLIEVIRKAYESLDMIDKMQSRNLEYQSKISKIHDNYQAGLSSTLGDKARITAEE